MPPADAYISKSKHIRILGRRVKYQNRLERNLSPYSVSTMVRSQNTRKVFQRQASYNLATNDFKTFQMLLFTVAEAYYLFLVVCF